MNERGNYDFTGKEYRSLMREARHSKTPGVKYRDDPIAVYLIPIIAGLLFSIPFCIGLSRMLGC